MHKTLTAGILAATLAVTSATSAQADELNQDDLGKLLFGIVAAITIGSLIRNSHDDEPAQQPAQVHQPHRGQQLNHWPRSNSPSVNPNRSQDTFVHSRPRHEPRTHTSQVNVNRALPASCLRSYRTRGSAQRAMGRSCLIDNFRGFRRLPNQCAIRYDTDRGQRRGFDIGCLRSHGFTVNRRR